MNEGKKAVTGGGNASRVRVGQIIEYLSYGQSCKGLVCRVTDNGTLFLTNGRFVFPESVLSVQRDGRLL